MKILVACRAFDNMAGGVERMAISLMNELCKRGHGVSLLTWDSSDAIPFYKMDERIAWHRLDMGHHLTKAGWKLRLTRAIKVRALVKNAKPDVILAFQHGTFLSMRLFTFGMGVPVIAAERNAPSRFDFLHVGKHRSLIFQSFRLAKKITVQCESYRNDYPTYLRKKIITISNPVFPGHCFALPKGRMEQNKILLSVGRLSYQKNYDVLLKAFALLKDKFSDWNLLIAGEGEDRAALENQIKILNLQDRAVLPGAVKDVQSLYGSAHLFCLPSRWEGFPNAMAEAMAHGLPAVGFAGCAGARDLIMHGENGFLAQGNDNESSLSEELARLMGDGELREEMGRKAIESMKSFSPDRIYDLWETALREAVRT